MSKEYIERGALLDLIGTKMRKMEGFDEYTDGKYSGLDTAFAFCEAVSAADVVEVVHAKWKYYHKQNIAVCTNCSFERDLDASFGKAIACPSCGAKMDGECK